MILENTKDKADMNEIQRMMYECLVKIRNNEVNLRWTRNQLFFLVNSVTLPLVASQMKIESIFYGLACVGGISLSILWVLVISMIQRWIDYWHGMLAALEGLDGEPVTIFKGPEWKSVRGHKMDATKISRLLALLFTGVWIIMFEYWWYEFILTP